MYISYSGHKTYKECPRQYWHRYIGKTELVAPENKVNSLYGSAVGILFEYFYNDRIWNQQGVAAALENRVDAVLENLIRNESVKGMVDWADPKANYSSLAALRRDVSATIPRGVAIIRHHRLLGMDAQAEVKLDSLIENHMIGGRADFIMRRIKPHDDLVILDGKGSKHREKYVDPQQLWWYAMLYRHKYSTLPDRLGFVFWRQEPESSMDWVEFDGSSLDGLLSGVLNSIQAIEDGKRQLSQLKDPVEMTSALNELFPTFIGDKCRLCAYQPVCVDGSSYVTRRVPAATTAGVEDVSFD